jgi:hypothetical protein
MYVSTKSFEISNFLFIKRQSIPRHDFFYSQIEFVHIIIIIIIIIIINIDLTRILQCGLYKYKYHNSGFI